jgi:hypothetical protein
MTTRDIMLVGAGLVGGYLLMGYLNKNKSNAQETTGSTGATVDQAKVDKCNAEVALQLQTAKFGTPEAQEAFKKSVFDACMAKS